MKKKQRLPWGRYLTIFFFSCFLLVVGLNLTSRPQAEQIQMSFGSSDDTDSGEVVRVSGNTSFTDSYQDAVNYANDSTCENGPSLACHVKQQSISLLETTLGFTMGAPSSSTGSQTTSDGGLIGDTLNLIAMTYTPPASGVYYVTDLVDNMGLAPNTYAQGYGYYSLTPYMQIWRLFRNIVYMIFAAIIIIISFLILFRQKIGGQAAITAQQALPRIIVALILVSFSYAIAGFIIDMMYWAMYAMASLVTIKDYPNKNEFINMGFGKFTWTMTAGSLGTTYTSIGDMVKGVFGDGVIGGIGSFISGVLGTVVVVIAMVFVLFRLFFLLLKSYATVLLYIMFSPFILMMQAIPGTNSFVSWVKKIVANLSPFFMTFFIVILSGSINYYTSQGTSSTAGASGFLPPFMSTISTESNKAKSLGSLVSLAMLLALPELLTSVKTKLGGGPGFAEEMAGNAWNNVRRGANSWAGRKVLGGAAGVGTGVLKGGSTLIKGLSAGLSQAVRSVPNEQNVNMAGERVQHLEDIKAQTAENARAKKQEEIENQIKKDMIAEGMDPYSEEYAEEYNTRLNQHKEEIDKAGEEATKDIDISLNQARAKHAQLIADQKKKRSEFIKEGASTAWQGVMGSGKDLFRLTKRGAYYGSKGIAEKYIRYEFWDGAVQKRINQYMKDIEQEETAAQWSEYCRRFGLSDIEAQKRFLKLPDNATEEQVNRAAAEFLLTAQLGKTSAAFDAITNNQPAGQTSQ